MFPILFLRPCSSADLHSASEEKTRPAHCVFPFPRKLSSGLLASFHFSDSCPGHSLPTSCPGRAVAATQSEAACTPRTLPRARDPRTGKRHVCVSHSAASSALWPRLRAQQGPWRMAVWILAALSALCVCSRRKDGTSVRFLPPRQGPSLTQTQGPREACPTQEVGGEGKRNISDKNQ